MYIVTNRNGIIQGRTNLPMPVPSELVIQTIDAMWPEPSTKVQRKARTDWYKSIPKYSAEIF